MANVVVVGGGIAGLEAALRLEKKLESQITLVEPREEMLFYPALHKVVEGEDPEETFIDLGEKLAERNINHVKQEMEGLEKENKVLELENSELKYEKLVLAIGSETNYFGVDRDNCLSLRSLEDAKEIRRKIEEGAEKAVVVGGGATGVEAVASLLETNIDVTLVQAGDRLLPQNTASLGRKAEKILENKGAEVLKGQAATEVTDKYVKLEEDEIRSDLTVWSAGIKPKDLLEELELPTSDMGVKVDAEMRVEDEEDIFAVGDVASYEGKEARAYHALSEAKTAAANIAADLGKGKGKENSFYWDPQVIYLGSRNAGMELFDRSFTGLIPHIVREYFIDKRYLFIRRRLL